MLTSLTSLAIAGGALRLVLNWQLKKRWARSLAVPQALAGALVVLAGLPEFLKPIPFPIPVGSGNSTAIKGSEVPQQDTMGRGRKAVGA